MTPPRSRSTLHAISPFGLAVAFAYIYLAWGATYLAIHFALESLPPLLLAGSRFFIAGTILLTLLRLKRPGDFYWGNAREWRDAALVGFLLLVGGNGVVAWAQLVVPSSLTALLFGSMPFWIILFDWLRPGGTAPTGRTWAGLVLGAAGVCVLVHPASGGPGGSPYLLAGEIALLLAACSWAAGAVYSRHVQARGSLLLPMARQMIAGGTILLTASLIHHDWTGFRPGRVLLSAWLGFGYLVLFGSVLGFTIYVWLMRVSTPARVATISYANLLVAVVLGCGVLGEPFTARLFWGALITISAVVLVLQKPARPPDVPSD
jgi:drug/metabolite transporter (DMT)-like permease